MPKDEEFETREGIIVGLIALGALAFLILTVFLASFGEGVDYTGGIGDISWGLKEWSTLGIFAIITGSIILAIYWGSDDEGVDDVFEGGYGFPLTILVLLIGLLLVNTQFLGLARPDTLVDTDGDGFDDTPYADIPSGYVDYGEPQPYGYGNYGPEHDGLLSDGEGAGVGCAGGAAVGLGLGLSQALWTAGISVPIGVAGGCLVGGLLGFTTSTADFDNDPTSWL